MKNIISVYSVNPVTYTFTSMKDLESHVSQVTCSTESSGSSKFPEDHVKKKILSFFFPYFQCYCDTDGHFKSTNCIKL